MLGQVGGHGTKKKLFLLFAVELFSAFPVLYGRT